jgi:23S rRNA (uracil747-C5)-methyltransferase
VDCPAFDAGRCRSCTALHVPYADQVTAKQARVSGLLAPFGEVAWAEPVRSAPAGYRNKAKLVVGGTAQAPTLGLLDAAGHGVDVTDCLLYEPVLASSFPALSAFVTRAALTPYDVPTRRGELKNLLVTVAPDGELMVRFVLRSTEARSRIRKHLPSLLTDLPTLRVASVNVLPEHAAVLAGEREEVLTDDEALPMRFGELVLALRPQGFFQTNTAVAAALYAQAAAWSTDAVRAWDLYCGVGGFALHLAAAGVGDVVGVETSEQAVEGATRAAERAGLGGVRFVADDATAFARAPRPDDERPDLVVVNPPRRGIGSDLAGWLDASGVARVLYSSCEPVTLARDLAAMPALRPVRARLFDMFPQTAHAEVLVELVRR